MEETKEKKNILFIIIFVLLILETGYIIYSNFIKTDNKPTNNNQSQVENEKTNEDNNIKEEQKMINLDLEKNDIANIDKKVD